MPNSDELEHYITLALISVLTGVATKYGISGATLTTICAGLAAAVVAAISIYRNANMKKVPENSTAIATPTPLPVGSNLPPSAAAAKVVGALLIGFLVLHAMPAMAQTKTPAKPAPKQITAAQAQQNPIAVIQQFTVTDIQNALDDANAQTPPDTVAANCYSALLTLVKNPINNPLPQALGGVLLFQKGRDLQALLANLQSPTGPLAPINTACAPLILSAQNTLIQLGIINGGVAAVASTGGLALPAMPLLSGLLAILPK